MAWAWAWQRVVARWMGWPAALLAMTSSCKGLKDASSGQVGCAPREITISDDSHDVLTGSRTWTAYCRGRTYFCSNMGGEISCREAQASERAGHAETAAEAEKSSRKDTTGQQERPAPAQATLGPFPDGAAGFKLGSAPAEAERACVASGLAWSATASGWECSGTPAAVGFDSKVALQFCGQKLCQLHVIAGTTPTSSVRERFDKWRGKLDEKYGTPTRSEIQVPDECAQDFVGCIKTGRAVAKVEWRWHGGRSILLMVRFVGADVRAIVSYVTPEENDVAL